MALCCCPGGLLISIFEKGDRGKTDIIKSNRKKCPLFKRVTTEPFENAFSSLSLRCLYIPCDAKQSKGLKLQIYQQSVSKIALSHCISLANVRRQIVE